MRPLMLALDASHMTGSVAVTRGAEPVHEIVFDASDKMPCLDRDGLIYYIDKSTKDLACNNIHAGVVWRKNIPELGDPAVETVGRYIYVSMGTRFNKRVYVYDRQGGVTDIYQRTGEYVCHASNLEGEVVGVIEDLS